MPNDHWGTAPLYAAVAHHGLDRRTDSLWFQASTDRRPHNKVATRPLTTSPSRSAGYGVSTTAWPTASGHTMRETDYVSSETSCNPWTTSRHLPSNQGSRFDVTDPRVAQRFPFSSTLPSEPRRPHCAAITSLSRDHIERPLMRQRCADRLLSLFLWKTI